MVRQPTVQTERLQLQPDEAKAVLVKQHEEPRGALRTREAVPGDQPRTVEAFPTGARVDLIAGHDSQGQDKGLGVRRAGAAAAAARLAAV